MKRVGSSALFFLPLFFLFTTAYSQTDCGNNAGFESGTTVGSWVCKSGTYGSVIWSGYCPNGSLGNCPTFPTVLSTIGILNPGGNNTLGNTSLDRHTIMTSSFRPWAGAGMGMDSISNNTVPVVAPGGGSFSFRLGDEVAGGFGANPNRLARAEAIRLTFNVNAANAGFTYRYAVFLQDPGHLPEEQPRFEVFVTQPDSNDQLIPCGYYKFVAGSTNPSCTGTRDSSTFKYGVGQWRYTDWTDVGLDLSGYIGQNISVEFRTSDCFPSQNVTYSSAGVQTTCTNILQPNGTSLGVCCWGSPQVCSTVSNCGIYVPGTHSAYAYIDAFCSSIATVPLPVCTGNDSVQICAPPGYKDWVWPNGKTTECIYVQTPTPGDSFTVAMYSQAGCPTKSTVKLTGTDVLVRDTAFCEGTQGNVTLAANLTFPGNYTFSWTGPGVNSAQQNPVIPIPANTSTYSISVTDTAAGCVYKKTMTVNIFDKPVVNISPNTSFCLGQNTQLSSSGNNVSCSWSPVLYLDNPLSCNPTAINPMVSTTYTVTVTDTNNCTNSDSTAITIYQPQLATAGAQPSSICLGSNTTLTATPGMAFYTWSPATSSPSSSSTTATPGITTTYTVAVRDINGCADTTTTTVIVNPLPVVFVSPDASICLGDTASLSASGGVVYSWTPVGGLDLPGDSVTGAHPNASTLYTVYVSNASGCSSSKSVNVFVYPPPVACTNDVNVCFGQSAQLDASCSVGSGHTWLPDPDLSDVNSLTPVAMTNSTKSYTIVVWSNISCLPDTAVATVTVHPMPVVTTRSDTTISAGDSTQLNSTGSGISYNWNPPTGLSCIQCQNPYASPLLTTQYIITTVDSFGCVSSDTVTVTVEDVFTLYVPSAFVPVNYNDKNTVFYAFGVGISQFEFYIFDRWGTLIFETHDPYVGWNGTYKGQMVQQDVYSYLAKAKSLTGKSITKTGPVTILR